MKPVRISALFNRPNDVLELVKEKLRKLEVLLQADLRQGQSLIRALIPVLDMTGMNGDTHSVGFR
jgi:hypothetical protein